MIENEILRGVLAGFAVLLVDIASYHSFVGYQFSDSHSVIKRNVVIIYVLKLLLYPLIFPILFYIFNIGNIYIIILSCSFVFLLYISNYLLVIYQQTRK